MWLADHLRGKDVLLLAGSNAEAADLARRVQVKLTQLGTVGPRQAALADGNHAGVGDLIRARLNTKIDAGGRSLTNRDTLQIAAFRGPDAEVRRQRLNGTWTGTFRIPRAYLAASAELAYAGNVHVAQGRTVDTAHLLVTESLSRQALYVGMTRGRQTNTAHVITGTTAPPGHEPYQQATPESVLAAIMSRDDSDLSATEQIRQAQDWTSGTGHLLTLWTAAIRQSLHPAIDQQITATLTETEARRYQREPSRLPLHQQLRAAQLAGHDIGTLIDQITAAPMDGAKSIASVLHGRLQRIPLPGLAGHNLTWAQRTPAKAPAVAHELAAALDARAGALGSQLTASPEPWLARHLGVPSSQASPALRAEYVRRAAAAATYREAAGITDPQQAISPGPHRGNPELEDMRQATIRALEIRDEADFIRGLTCGALEARVRSAERAYACAPPEVSVQLRLTAQAEAESWQQAADAATKGNQAQIADTQRLASQLATQRERLEVASALYGKWSIATTGIRETGAEAKAELGRRSRAWRSASQSQSESGREPQAIAAWWRQLEADLAAVGTAPNREHQAVIAAGHSWPPRLVRVPEASLVIDNEPHSQSARLDEMLSQATGAAGHLAADRAAQKARPSMPPASSAKLSKS
jgi:hypothetical protein